MSQTIDAVYEGGAFRPLKPEQVQAAEGERVQLVVQPEPIPEEELPEILKLARRVYEGLSEEEIQAIEAEAFNRTNWGLRSDIAL